VLRDVAMATNFGTQFAITVTQLPPEKKGTPHPHPVFDPCLYCGQMAGWMKTPLGTEVDLGPGHIN